MATGKICADINFINPYPHAKIRTRTRTRTRACNSSRVGNNSRTRYPRIPACPRIPVPVRRSRTKSTWPGRGRRAPQARGLGAGIRHRRRVAWVRPAREPRRGQHRAWVWASGAALVSWDGRAASGLGAAVRPCPIPVCRI
jgi:hypothetical protein